MKKMIALLCLGLPLWIPAQTNELNLGKYWSYRERLRKDFVRIGPDEGMSIPASARSIGFAHADVPENASGHRPSRMYYQDATIYLGHYLIVLATESYLLNQELLESFAGQNSGTVLKKREQALTELYFALNALDRLDQGCEGYLLSNEEITAENGLLMRDDVRHSFHSEHYDEDYSAIFSRSCDFIRTHSDYRPVQVWEPGGPPLQYNPSNVMSLDQITTVLNGLLCVYRLAPDLSLSVHEEVGTINVREKAREIALRILNYVIRPEPDCGGDCWSFNIRVPHTIFRPAGYDCSLVAPMMIKLAKEFGHPYWASRYAAADFSGMRIAIQIHPEKLLPIADNLENMTIPLLGNALDNCADNMRTFSQMRMDWGVPVTIGYIEYEKLREFLEDIVDQEVDLSLSGNPCYTINNSTTGLLESFHLEIYDLPGCGDFLIDLFINSDIFTMQILDILGVSQNVICISNFPEFEHLSDLLNDDNIHIFSEWLTISDFASPSYIAQIVSSPLRGMDWYTMLHALLYNQKQPYPFLSSSYLEEQYLDTAPCSGLWDDPLTQVLPTPGTQEGWRAANRLFHPSDAILGIPDPSFRGEYSGLDYMVYYNLYHVLWRPELPVYTENSYCACTSGSFNEQVINHHRVLSPKFSDYREYGITIPDRIHQSMVFQTEQAEVEIKNDLVICSGAPDSATVVTLTDGAVWKLYGGCELRLGEGTVLVIENDAVLMGGLYNDINPSLGNDARLVVGRNATLLVRNHGSLLPHAGLEIVVEEGGQWIMDNSTCYFHANSAGSSVWLERGALLKIANSSVFENNGQQPLICFADSGSVVQCVDSEMRLPLGGWNLEGASFLAENSGIYLGEGAYTCRYAKLEMNNSILELNRQFWNFYSGSEIEFEESSVLMHQSVFRIGDTHQVNATYDAEPSGLEIRGSLLHLIGPESRLELKKVHMEVPDHSHSVIKSESDTGGRIWISPGDETGIDLGAGATLKIVGTGKNNTIVELGDHGSIRVSGTSGSVFLQDGRFSLEPGSFLHVSSALEMERVFLSKITGEQTASLRIQHPNVSVRYSDFYNCMSNAIGTHLKMNTNQFLTPSSGFILRGGSFQVVNCHFDGCGISSGKLESVSSISQSHFLNEDGLHAYKALEDASLVEIWVNNCEFSNYTYGIYKLGGVLSLRCNLMRENEVGVFVDHAKLNMSSSAAAGYNTFENNQCNIEAANMLEYGLNKGYNRFEPYQDCNIWTTALIPCWGDDIMIPANNNIWTLSDGIHLSQNTTGPVSSSCISECYPIGSGCSVLFYDAYPVSENQCPADKVSVKPPSRKWVNAWDIDDILQPDRSRDTEVPVIETQNFRNVPLDSALAYAASYLEVYDSLGSDWLAVELFQEILETEIDRNDAYNRQLINWGIVMMKNGVEGLFNSAEITPADNAESFHFVIQRYVDILNANTDTLLSAETYRDQFYNELIKGQLFMTLGDPAMASEIYGNLNTCGLDTLEVIQLAYWQQQASEYAILLSNVENWEVSSEPGEEMGDTAIQETGVESNYTFGSLVHGPDNVSFIACGEDPVYRGLWDDELKLELYPNPALNQVTIRVDTDETIRRLRVYDSFGRELRNLNLRENAANIIVLELSTDWPGGEYIVVLEGQDFRCSRVFVKQ